MFIFYMLKKILKLNVNYSFFFIYKLRNLMNKIIWRRQCICSFRNILESKKITSFEILY